MTIINAGSSTKVNLHVVGTPSTRIITSGTKLSILTKVNTSILSVNVVTSKQPLSVKMVLGQRGEKGSSPSVSVVGDQLSIDGVLGPHLTVPISIPESLDAVASTILGGHRVVQVFNGIASYADCVDNYYGQLGLTMSATDQGSSFKLFTTGVVSEPSWNFTQGPVFLGTNGLLTQNKPVVGTVVLVGRAISSTAISLQFQQLYRRT